MRYTIKDIAKAAHVSVATVSKVLNSYEDIRPETRELVMKTIERMDFVPNNFARYIANQSTHVIGLTVPDIKDPYSAQCTFGIESGLMENDYDLFLGNVDRKEERFLKFIHKAREMRFDGLIITPDKWTSGIINVVNRLDIPVLSIRRRPPEECKIPFIDSDHIATANTMLSYLYEKGHRKIAHVVLSNEGGFYRHQAYRNFCKQYGLEKRTATSKIPAAILEDGIKNGIEGCTEILEKWPDTTAIFCGSDFIAMGVMVHLHNRGLRVPDDISVAGVGNMENASLPWFNLTTMELHRNKMGYKASELILQMLKGEEIENTLFDSTLIERKSVRSI